MTPEVAVTPDIRALGEEKLERLWARGRAFLGTRYAILGGAMSWVSEHTLVAAISNAGGFGILATGSMTPRELGAEIERTLASTAKPFGVNLITMHPDLAELCDVCLRRGVSHVVLAGGLPKLADVARLKDGGAQVLGFAPSLGFARRLVRSGVGAIILEGAEAGGHIGSVSAGVLAQEILPHLSEVPAFVAGGIGRGEAMAMYLQMGAAGCQLGTRFVCASESVAHPRFKQAFIKARARDAAPTTQVDSCFSVIPVRALANAGTRRFHEFQSDVVGKFQSGQLTKVEAQLKIERFWAGRLRDAVIDGDVKDGSMMAGQSVGMVTSIQPTAEIIAELVEQAALALAANA